MAGGKISSGKIVYAGANTPGWISNFGMSYSAGTFKLCQADGTDFNPFNPGWVTLPSTTSGALVTLKCSVSPSFIDDVGASQIVGEQFGVTTGVAWAEDRPFYIYAINKDNTDAGLTFGISPNPCLINTPSSANNLAIKGTPSVTPTDNNIFLLAASAASLTSKPCVVIGGIRMRMSTSDDWTVQTLTTSSGDMIRSKPYENKYFNFPLAQMGAATGTYLIANGGTAPIFSANVYKYLPRYDGIVSCVTVITGDGGTDGAGAVDAQLSFPYATSALGLTTEIGTSGKIIATTLSASPFGCLFELGSSQSYGNLKYIDSGGLIQTVLNSDFSNGNRLLVLNFSYNVFGN